MTQYKGFRHKNFTKKGSCMILSHDSWYEYALDMFTNLDEPAEELVEVTSERRLCFAILARAMADAKGVTSFSTENNPTPKKERNAASDARGWIMSESFEPFSFLWICQEVDLPSQTINFIRGLCCGH